MKNSWEFGKSGKKNRDQVQNKGKGGRAIGTTAQSTSGGDDDPVDTSGSKPSFPVKGD